QQWRGRRSWPGAPRAPLARPATRPRAAPGSRGAIPGPGASRLDLIEKARDGRGRDGDAEPAGDQGVDSHHPTARVGEWPPRVAWREPNVGADPAGRAAPRFDRVDDA